MANAMLFAAGFAAGAGVIAATFAAWIFILTHEREDRP